MKEVAKNKGGRPPMFGTTMLQVHVPLPQKSIDIAKRIGNQNMSNGIRIALDMADKKVRRKENIA